MKLGVFLVVFASLMLLIALLGFWIAMGNDRYGGLGFFLLQTIVLSIIVIVLGAQRIRKANGK